MLDVYALTCISLSYENNIEVSLNFGWFSYPTKSGKDNMLKNCTPRN